MKIIRKTDELQKILVLIKDKGQSIGSVLTMGNLHDGHLSLIKDCLLYTSPSPRDLWISRMPSSA